MQPAATEFEAKRAAFVSPVVNRSRLYTASTPLNSHFQNVRKLHIGTLNIIRDLKTNLSSRSISAIFRRVLNALPYRNISLDNLSSVPEDHIVALVQHFYPPRVDIPVEICDFGLGKFERKKSSLGEVEKYWKSKPSWSQIRWIHIPVGENTLQWVLEDAFKYAGPMGELFNSAGSPSWPYIDIESLTFRSYEDCKSQRDVLSLLSGNTAVEAILAKANFRGEQGRVLTDHILDQSQRRGLKFGFWDCVLPDMPNQLSEDIGAGFNGGSVGLRVNAHVMDEQMIRRHPFFRDAQIAKNRVKFFHRGDGYLLTFSPPLGLGLVDKDFETALKSSTYELFDDAWSKTFARICHQFCTTGTSNWPQKTMLWFMTYLATELLASPDTMAGGNTAPSMENAYYFVVQELKRRRNEEWADAKAVNLVRDFTNYNDELSYIIQCLNYQSLFLSRLKDDVMRIEQSQNVQLDPQLNQMPTTMDRIEWAQAITEGRLKQLRTLLDESRRSMDALRSIEQNELAIAADGTSKAMLALTIVTVVFLPLSFFTSYFGMNLADIRSSEYEQDYFWKMCGPITVCILFLTIASAFRRRIGKTLRSKPRLFMQLYNSTFNQARKRSSLSELAEIRTKS